MDKGRHGEPKAPCPYCGAIAQPLRNNQVVGYNTGGKINHKADCKRPRKSKKKVIAGWKELQDFFKDKE